MVVQDNQGTHAGIPLTIQQAGSLWRGEERGGSRRDGREQRGGEGAEGRGGSRGEGREQKGGEGAEGRGGSRGEGREQKGGERVEGRGGSRGDGREQRGGERRPKEGEWKCGSHTEAQTKLCTYMGSKTKSRVEKHIGIRMYSIYTRTYVRTYTSAIEKAQWKNMQWTMR